MADESSTPANPQSGLHPQQTETMPPAQGQGQIQPQPQGQPQPQPQPQDAAWQQPYQAQAAQPAQPAQASWQQPPANPYAQPAAPPQPSAPPQAAVAPQKNGKAVAALICGIAGIVFAPSIILGVGLGIVAMVLAILANAQAPNGKAKAGFICGAVAVVLSAILIVAWAAMYSANPNGFTAPFGANSKSSAPKTLLVDEVPGTVIADDQVCTMKLTRMDIDADGNLNISFTLTDHTVKELTLKTETGVPWEVNGTKAEIICYTWVKPGETKEDVFTIPAAYLPVKSIDEITSISGKLIADVGTSVPMEYPVYLY